jgi:hypothetical protein
MNGRLETNIHFGLIKGCWLTVKHAERRSESSAGGQTDAKKGAEDSVEKAAQRGDQGMSRK